MGKSEAVKIIANEYTGEKPIILNMAEYNSPSAISRIIGAPSGYVGSDSNRELTFDILDTNPYKVILLDEFEKCDRSVQRLFMSAFDEGVMETNSGKETDFSKTIIIATTNAGCTQKIGNIGFGCSKGADNLSVSELTEHFDTELINRFSHIYTFHSIEEDVYAQILMECMKKEISGLALERLPESAAKRIRSAANEKTVKMLCDRSYNIKLGARPAMTIIREFIDELVLECMDKEESDENTVRSAGKRHLLNRIPLPALETDKCVV